MRRNRPRCAFSFRVTACVCMTYRFPSVDFSRLSANRLKTFRLTAVVKNIAHNTPPCAERIHITPEIIRQSGRNNSFEDVCGKFEKLFSSDMHCLYNNIAYSRSLISCQGKCIKKMSFFLDGQWRRGYMVSDDGVMVRLRSP